MQNPLFSRPVLSVRAIVLDWAGTAVDFGSCAPVHAFIAAFSSLGIQISSADARGPMGRHKRDHLAAIFALTHVAAQWQQAHGRLPTEADIDTVFAAFVPAQMAVLGDFATPIPGVVEVIDAWREQGIRIGSTTGYTRAMLDVVAASAARQGYAPDSSFAADQVPAGRPAPWMIWQNLQTLGVWPPAAVVKIGDTVADIDEGLNAGCWTVALTTCGNEVGLNQAEFEGRDAATRAAQVLHAGETLTRAGCHYLASSWAEIPSILADINARLAAGDRP